ncbi:hypothetical protein QZM46_17630 [Burkholderia vietnamiensis]|uniref:hypothetical protein n=1 Tax=Burkholderia TaxID=32008 RepID=UPI002652B56A|nr:MULTISPECIES: hypothetical protein [Burkholderia]MDN7429014.1 hypothetical protein [Burkholderia sp. AU45388]MDN7553143.1 hypothetical protein [Burkholderia vietnamiensis]HDR9093364.1 hypothetical protein [Burkholderia vietnamiensis]
MSAPHVTQREFAKLAGCDEKQVRRAIASGKLKPDADGRLDPALVSSGWRRPIRSSKTVADSADTSKVSAKTVRTESVRAPVVDENDSPTEAAAKLVMAMGATNNLAEAIRIKENFNALLKQLEYEQKSGSLVDLSVARTVLFDCARAARDSWMNWPMRVGPKIAADLGLEADRVTEVLIEHVHRQIADLGEPDAHFDGSQS